MRFKFFTVGDLNASFNSSCPSSSGSWLTNPAEFAKYEDYYFTKSNFISNLLLSRMSSQTDFSDILLV